MGRALKTVGVIIGGAALIATGVGALAMPALAGTTTLFGVSVGTLNTISSGLVAVGGMLDKPKSQGSASPDEWTSNPDQPIPFLMGRMGVAGKIVQRDEFGPDNMYQGIVGIISGAGPIRTVTAFAGDKQPVTFGANGIAISSQWQGEMWMVRRSGAQPDTALSVPVGLKSGGDAFEWSSAAKLSGRACYLQVLGENSKGTAYPAGIPDPMHEAEGIYGYDPRYDDLYPGGAGPCRLGVRSTYRWIEDGGIGGLNWALGLVENGQVVGGIGASIDGIDVPAFVEVANIADANGWKLAAWPDTSEDASAVLDQLLQAAGAVRARHAGKISCVSRGAPRASVATITARDTAGDIELDTAPSLFNRLNTITPRFMSSAAGWVLTPANPVSFAQYVTDDGGKHGDQIDYRFVPLLKQAAELAAYDILDAREPFSGTIPLKAHMRHLKRGDTFLVSEPGFLMDGVKCIVLSRSYDPKTAQVRIGFRSETDSKHALALGKTTTLPAFPVLTPVDPLYVGPPVTGDWEVTVRDPSEAGSQVAIFDVVGSVKNATATGIIIELSPDGADPWQLAWSGPPTATNIPVSGMQPGVSYFVAISYQRGQNVSNRLILGPFDTPEITALSSEDSEALDRLDRIESDNWLSKGEKPEVILQWDGAAGEYSGLSAALLAAGLTSARSNYVAAYNALGGYLAGLSPAWNDLAQDTPITGADLRTAFRNYYVAKQQANTALVQAVGVDARAALDAIVIIGSDAWLSQGEKPAVKRELDVFLNDYPSLATQASVLGITTALTAHSAAVNALRDYLQGLTPSYTDVTQNTPVVPTTFAAKFSDAYTTRQTLLNAFTAAINSTASTAAADAAAAIARIAVITSDSILSKDEKPGLIRDWQVIVSEFPGYRDRALAIGATTARADLMSAYDALSIYLSGLSPAYNDLTQDTPIVPATFTARFHTYYVARATLLNAMVGIVGTDAANALAAITRISSDNYLSAGEKSEVIRQYSTFLGDYPGLQAQASALGISTALTAHTNAVNALTSYLSGLSPAYNNVTTDTVIDGGTFRAKFNDAYLTKTALQTAIAAAIGADASAALSRLDVIVADGWLSRNEKPRVIQDYAVVLAEYVDLINKGNAAGATGQVSGYTAAITNLNNYLFGLSPAWDNLSADTAISGPTLRGRWADYYASKTALQTAISTANGSTPLKITASSRGISRNVSGAGTYTTTSSISLAVTGGSGSYGYDWFLTGASSDGNNARYASITGSSGSSCAFTATVAAGEMVIGSFACEVRDTVTGAKFTSLHTGRILETS